MVLWVGSWTWGRATAAKQAHANTTSNATSHSMTKLHKYGFFPTADKLNWLTERETLRPVNYCVILCSVHLQIMVPHTESETHLEEKYENTYIFTLAVCTLHLLEESLFIAGSDPSISSYVKKIKSSAESALWCKGPLQGTYTNTAKKFNAPTLTLSTPECHDQ